MFALPVAKPKSAAPQRSAVAALRPGQAAPWGPLLQPAVNNQVMLRLLAQRGSATPNESGAHENQDDAARIAGRAGTPSWDFNKTPVSSLGRAEQFQTPPVFPAPRLAGAIQAKLFVGEVNSPLEHEADRVAEHVIRMSAPASAPPQINRKCATCEEEENLQKKSAGSQPTAAGVAPAIVHEVLRSPGQPLDASSRAYFEPRFGHDFSKVRTYADARAAESAAAVNAHAYTVGGDIVFGAGQHAPGTERGKRLLAHELAHVVQQNSSPPAGIVSRKASKNDEEQKKLAVANHKRQQTLVSSLFDEARKVVPNSKNPLEADTLFHETVQFVDDGKMNLRIMTPTHYSTDAKRAHFDTRVLINSKQQGDYPADPAATDSGLFHPDPNVIGKTIATSSTIRDVLIFTPEFTLSKDNKITDQPDISAALLKQTLVHEGQHAADLSILKFNDPSLQPWQVMLEAYESEFRAHWIQPTNPSLVSSPVDNLPPTEKRGGMSGPARNQTKVTIAKPDACAICPVPKEEHKGPAASPAAVQTNFKNWIQEIIFWELIRHHPSPFDCFYVCSQDFRKAVDAFDQPAGLNVINSSNMFTLNLELPKLAPTMTQVDIGKTGFVAAVKKLDPIDWAFLGNRQQSGPFWRALKLNAPKFVFNAMDGWAKKGKPTATEIAQALEPPKTTP
jgi:hypothetical protein